MLHRECGTCHVCCTETRVQLHDCIKSEGDACKHLKGNCSIYSERPVQCIKYRCAWLDGFGDVSDRPDKSGIIADFKTIEGREYVCAREVKNKAWKKVGKHILLCLSTRLSPILLKLYKSNNETGDFVIVESALLKRTERLRGEHILNMASNVDAYELVIGG